VVARWAATLQMSVAVVTVAAEVAAPLVAGGVRASGGFGPVEPERYVAGLATAWATDGVEVTGEVVRDPIGVASGLRQHLGRAPAGLVALATHVRTGLERVRLGATAADIVRTSTAPVLVVPVRVESS